MSKAPPYAVAKQFLSATELLSKKARLQNESDRINQDDGFAYAYVYRGGDPLVEQELSFHAAAAYVQKYDAHTGKTNEELVCIHLYHPSDISLINHYGFDKFENYGTITNHFRDVLGLMHPDENFFEKQPLGYPRRNLNGKSWLTQHQLDCAAQDRQDNFYRDISFFRDQAQAIVTAKIGVVQNELNIRQNPVGLRFSSN